VSADGVHCQRPFLARSRCHIRRLLVASWKYMLVNRMLKRLRMSPLVVQMSGRAEPRVDQVQPRRDRIVDMWSCSVVQMERHGWKRELFDPVVYSSPRCWMEMRIELVEACWGQSHCRCFACLMPSARWTEDSKIERSRRIGRVPEKTESTVAACSAGRQRTTWSGGGRLEEFVSAALSPFRFTTLLPVQCLSPARCVGERVYVVKPACRELHVIEER
jgi:hypothetical protein